MDPRLLQYYNRELQHIREMGGEFAREYPKIAGRLGLEQFECADPYVERLLEGFAFLAARVQIKVDAVFPEFTQHLLEVVYPHYLSPTPSMAVVQMQPDLAEGSLVDGFVVPRGTALRSQIGRGEQTACEYRTAHDVTLWPLQVAAVEYLASAGALSTRLGIPDIGGMKAGLRLRLRTTAGLSFGQLALNRLSLFLRGSGDLSVRLYEALLARSVAVLSRPVPEPLERPPDWQRLPASVIRRIGYSEDEALLPYGSRSFHGYRLLQEYFALPDRYLFVELGELREGVRRAGAAREMDFVVLFDRQDQVLTNAIDANHIALFCTPAANLFPRSCDRIHLDAPRHEYHIVPDRTRPMDYEVHSITEVVGYGSTQTEEQLFLPFYGSKTGYRHRDEQSYYAIRREKRLLSARQRREDAFRSSYIGSESFVSLVDAHQAPYSGSLKQLGLQVLCTNRDLPLLMPVGVGDTDFFLQTGAPVQSIRCLVGPTKPRPSAADGEVAWKLINHLSLNYLSLSDTDPTQGAAALRELLSLYGEYGDASTRKQIDGVFSIQSRNTVRRVDVQGPIVFGRGLEIRVAFDESAYEGSGIFLLGAVLEQFFARYAAINTFTETVIESNERGEVMRWPIRIGTRHTI